MHVRKAHDQLMKLASAPADLDTLIKATVFLDGLERDNVDVGEGERINGTARDKIHSARANFEILCGLGEDGDWSEERIRHFIRCDLSAVYHEITTEGLHFQRWFDESTTDEL
jgi:hypothetical protein